MEMETLGEASLFQTLTRERYYGERPDYPPSNVRF